MAINSQAGCGEVKGRGPPRLQASRPSRVCVRSGPTLSVGGRPPLPSAESGRPRPPLSSGSPHCPSLYGAAARLQGTRLGTPSGVIIFPRTCHVGWGAPLIRCASGGGSCSSEWVASLDGGPGTRVMCQGHHHRGEPIRGPHLRDPNLYEVFIHSCDYSFIHSKDSFSGRCLPGALLGPGVPP